MLPTFAQLSHRVRVSIPITVELEARPGNKQNTNIVFRNGDDLETGKEELLAGTYQVRANTNWLVTAKPSKSHFTFASDGSESAMPTSILSIRESSTTDFFQLDEKGVEIISGNSGGEKAKKNSFSIDYKAAPGNDYAPGDYETDVLLTITSI